MRPHRCATRPERRPPRLADEVGRLWCVIQYPPPFANSRRPGTLRALLAFRSITTSARSLNAVDAPARLPVRGALDESDALVEQSEIVGRGRVARVESQRVIEHRTSLRQLPAQHIGVSLVIEDARGMAHQFDRGCVAAIGEIESPQAIVTRRQSDPGGRVLGRFFDRVLEVLLGETEIAFLETLDAQFHRLVRRVVLDVGGVLSRDRIGDRIGRRGRLAAGQPDDEKSGSRGPKETGRSGGCRQGSRSSAAPSPLAFASHQAPSPPRAHATFGVARIACPQRRTKSLLKYPTPGAGQTRRSAQSRSHFPASRAFFWRLAALRSGKSCHVKLLRALQPAGCGPEPPRNREFQAIGTGNSCALSPRIRERTGGAKGGAKTRRGRVVGHGQGCLSRPRRVALFGRYADFGPPIAAAVLTTIAGAPSASRH